MKIGKFAQLSTVALILTTSATITQPSYAQSKKFECGISRGVPATLVNTSRGKIPMIRWVDKAFPQPWTPERRCEEISDRFQRFYDNGTLKYLATGSIRGQSVLCVASFKGGPCLTDGVLVTLKPITPPEETLERLVDYRGKSGSGIIELSGKRVFSSINGQAYLDVEKLIVEKQRVGATCPRSGLLRKC